MLKKNIFEINAVLLNFTLIKAFWKKNLYTTVFNIENNNTYLLSINHHIRMISEGSCDTEDWSNDAENSTLITEINYYVKYWKIENSCFKLE